MTSFSERMEFVKPPEFMQLNSMTEELSDLLVNFCCRCLNVNGRGNLSEIEDQINDLLKKRRRTFQLWALGGGMGHLAVFNEKLFATSFEKLEFYEKYSVVEMVVVKAGLPNGDRMGFSALLQIDPITELNQILERENSGFRLNDDCQLVPVTDQQELDEVTEALYSKVDMVAFHMNKAVACFADREKPDYDNSIKESVSALEALAQKITGKSGKNATLGKLIKELNLHPCLIQVVDKLYGYTSDGGIRHAKKEGDPDVDFDTAKFVIVTSSALINFITAKSVVSEEA
jgi:hypothetical protein